MSCEPSKSNPSDFLQKKTEEVEEKYGKDHIGSAFFTIVKSTDCKNEDHDHDEGSYALAGSMNGRFKPQMLAAIIVEIAKKMDEDDVGATIADMAGKLLEDQEERAALTTYFLKKLLNKKGRRMVAKRLMAYMTEEAEEE